MVTSDFTPEVEIRPFRACAMKNTQYNAYLWPNRRNSMHPAIIIGTVRSLIVDVAMGQIPRSTERISSWTKISISYYYTY